MTRTLTESMAPVRGAEVTTVVYDSHNNAHSSVCIAPMPSCFALMFRSSLSLPIRLHDRVTLHQQHDNSADKLFVSP